MYFDLLFGHGVLSSSRGAFFFLKVLATIYKEHWSETGITQDTGGWVLHARLPGHPQLGQLLQQGSHHRLLGMMRCCLPKNRTASREFCLAQKTKRGKFKTKNPKEITIP
jgi:hypothetical protein